MSVMGALESVHPPSFAGRRPGADAPPPLSPQQPLQEAPRLMEGASPYSESVNSDGSEMSPQGESYSLSSYSLGAWSAPSSAYPLPTIHSQPSQAHHQLVSTGFELRQSLYGQSTILDYGSPQPQRTAVGTHGHQVAVTTYHQPAPQSFLTPLQGDYKDCAGGGAASDAVSTGDAISAPSAAPQRGCPDQVESFVNIRQNGYYGAMSSPQSPGFPLCLPTLSPTGPGAAASGVTSRGIPPLNSHPADPHQHHLQHHLQPHPHHTNSHTHALAHDQAHDLPLITPPYRLSAAAYPFHVLPTVGGSGLLSSAHLTLMSGYPSSGLTRSLFDGLPPSLDTARPVEKPYKCNRCPSAFNRNHDMKRHMRIHWNSKPFSCTVCDKKFSRKDALKRHQLVRGCGKLLRTQDSYDEDAAVKPEPGREWDAKCEGQFSFQARILPVKVERQDSPIYSTETGAGT